MKMITRTIITVIGSQVVPLAAWAEDIRDVRSPINLPANYLAWFLLGGALILVVAFFLFKYFTDKNKQGKLNTVPPIPAWQRAFMKLAALKAQGLLEKGNFKEFYLVLSDIVRTYFEEELAIKAPEMTTEEFLQYLKESGALLEKQKSILKNFLFSCDMVKFAKYTPQVKEAEDSFHFAKQLIEETKKATPVLEASN